MLDLSVWGASRNLPTVRPGVWGVCVCVVIARSYAAVSKRGTDDVGYIWEP